jgi:hypothetical protein
MMAGFGSIDDLINQVTTNGKFWRADWNKLFNPTTAAAVGEWHVMSRGGGNPPADAMYDASTHLLFQSCHDISTLPGASGSIQHGGNVGANGDGFKVILNASSFSASGTNMPSVLMLVDMLAFHYVNAPTTTTAQNTINSNTFTAADGAPGILITYGAGTDFVPYQKVRFTTSGTLPGNLSLNTDYWLIRVNATSAKVASTYANAIAGTAIAWVDAGSGTHTVTCRLPRYSDGTGVQTIIFNPHLTALGAATPNFTIGYTNSAGTASRATPSSPALPQGKSAASNTLVLYSGTGAGKFGPFVPLQAGDAGVRLIQTIQHSVSYLSGQYTVAYCRPLLTLPMTTVGVAAERDLVNQLPSMPRVYDGACLVWMLYSGALTPANSTFYGHIDFGWS